MTKAEEIRILEDTIERLGEDSYTGPWLKEQLPAILMEIRDDLPPGVLHSMTFTEARARADGIVEEARLQAQRIKAKSEAEAKLSLDRTMKQLDVLCQVDLIISEAKEKIQRIR